MNIPTACRKLQARRTKIEERLGPNCDGLRLVRDSVQLEQRMASHFETGSAANAHRLCKALRVYILVLGFQLRSGKCRTYDGCKSIRVILRVEVSIWVIREQRVLKIQARTDRESKQTS